MNTTKHVTLALVALFAATTVQASPTSTLLKTRASYKAAVTTGKWQSNFYKAKKYATSNKLPFIAVWSNGDTCGHCVTFEGAVNSSYFRKWMASSGMVFYFTYYGDRGNGTTTKSGSSADNGAVASDIFHWCRKNKNTSYPFVRIYWPAGKVDVATVGDTVDGKKDGNAGGKKCVAYFKSKLSKFKPVTPVVVPKYTGGGFSVGDVESDRLEAEIGSTTKVELPLSRTNTVASTVSTNTVVVSYPGGSPASVTNTFIWSSGESETNLTVNIPAGLTNANEKVEILLLDAAGKAVATSHVTMVEAPENSPSNPLWIDEKTADTLAWGEWTMDLDVATNKVNAYNAAAGTATSGSGGIRLGAPASEKDRAYTLLLLEGSQWCGDCKNTDEYLFMQDEFKTWAQENKVALVALDLPYVNKTADLSTALSATAPTLLTSDSLWGRSGASYVSRKMVDKTKAAEVLERNYEIAYGLRLPNWSNKNRPPVPSIFVLRDDGTVAGRIQYFGVTSPTNALNIDAHIKRLDEMLLQVDEPAEEANDKAAWTTEVIGPRTNVVSKTVSFSDVSDVYMLNPDTTYGRRLSFTLSGEDKIGLELKVMAGSEVVAQAAGLLSDGVTVGAEVKSSEYYVSVGYATTNSTPVDAHFAVDSKESTLCSYALTTDFVVEPTELAADNHIVIEDGVNEVTVSLVSNQTYRITNLDTADPGNLEALDATTGLGDTDSLYVAQVTGDVRLALSAAETDIQKWNPGTVGFAVSSASTLESAGSYVIRLVRQGGVSGTATVNLSVNADKSSKYENLYVLPDDFGEAITWQEGDDEEKTIKLTIVDNDFADGNQVIYFQSSVTGDASVGMEQFRLTLRDNDRSEPGKIAITETLPAMAKAMYSLARAGDSMSVQMSRVDGTTGDLSVSLAASAGELEASSFSWSNRTASAQSTLLTLPSVKGKIKVMMTPDEGSYVDGTRRVLTVDVLDAEVPGFVVNTETVAATRYIPLEEIRIALDDKATDATTVRKYSGALPAGVKWTFDGAGKELVISGVPTKAGSYTSVYRAVTGSTAGLTVSVTLDVADPVTTGGGDDGTEPLNVHVAKTRVFADIPVFDMTTNRLAGVFTLTLPRSGRASAKYRGVDAGTVSLSCASWSEIQSDGTLKAVLTGKTASGGSCTNTVSARPDGTIVVDFADSAEPEHDFEVLLSENAWSKSSPATDFKGYYTVSLPIKKKISGTPLATGSGYATFKMNTALAVNSGKFVYAGMLPDGRAISGSVVATPADWTVAASTSFWARAVLPVVSLGKIDTFAGAFQITPGAADSSATNMVSDGMCMGRCSYKAVRRSVANSSEADLFWRHTESVAAASYEAALEAYGAYYLSTDNFASCCQTTFKSTGLKFFVQDVSDGDDGAWPTNGAPSVTVTYTKKTKANAIKAASNSRGLTLAFTPSTGIVSGKFKLDGETMTYRGVVLPGWGSGECVDCGFSDDKDGGAEAQLRPFISGAAWFNSEFDYKDGDGEDQTMTVRSGCPFSIGLQSGK